MLEAQARRLGRAGLGAALEPLLGQLALTLGPLAGSGRGRGDLLGLVAATPGLAQLMLEAADPLFGRGQVAHRLAGPIGLVGAGGELAREVPAQGLLGVRPLLGDPARALALLQRGGELVAHGAGVPQLILQRVDPLRQLGDAAGLLKIRWLFGLVRLGLEGERRRGALRRRGRLEAKGTAPDGPDGAAASLSELSPGAGTATGNGTTTVPN